MKNVWGNHVRSLSFEEVADVAAGVTKDLQGEWALSDNDVERHYASIVYVARVRVEDGQVLVAPVDTVLDSALSDEDAHENPSIVRLLVFSP